MHVEVRDCHRPTSLEEIADFEARMGYKFPEEYRVFLLKFNGGHPEPCRFRWGAGLYQDSMISWFLAIDDGKLSNMEWHYSTFKNDDKRVPDPFVPIAYDPGGNLICIDTSVEGGGAVYFWDHETELSPGGPEMSRVAGSFNEFMSSLMEK